MRFNQLSAYTHYIKRDKSYTNYGFNTYVCYISFPAYAYQTEIHNSKRVYLNVIGYNTYMGVFIYPWDFYSPNSLVQS